MTITLTILESLFPVLALVVAGYLFRKKGFLPLAFWQAAESLTYFVLFPALILYRLINADFAGAELGRLTIVILIYFAALTIASYFIDKKLIGLSHPSWTSYLQGSIRYNTFIALALVDKLFGAQLFALSALVVGLFITIVNIITIIAFNTQGHSSAFSPEASSTKALSTVALSIGKSLFKNPLILASVAGMGINLAGLQTPMFISDTLAVFGRGALPLAILAVGAGLKLKSLTRISPALSYSTLNKLILSPVIMAIIAWLLLDDLITIKLLVIFAAIPTASAAYILAKKLGGDADLMASIITLQTLVSTLSVTLLLFLIL